MASESLPRIDPRLAARLDEKKVRLDRQRPLSDQTLRSLYRELRVLLTFHSNAIEGNTLTLRETALVLEQGLTVGGHPLREHLEATNHAKAFDEITRYVADRAPITLELITTINGFVVHDLIAQAGRFRTGYVTIRGAKIQPPHSREVPKLMQEWVAWLDGEGRHYHPVLRAALAHHGFEAVHPFQDGNGRTGRLLMNMLLMQDGYPPALLLQEWRLGYLEALSAADTGHYRPLANLVGRAVEQGLDLYLSAVAATFSADEADDYLRLADLAAASPYSAAYLALLIRKGRLEGVKRGRMWYSTHAAVERYTREVAQELVPNGRPPAARRR